MLKITTGDLAIQIVPLDRQFEAPGGPYLEWIDVLVKISAPGIDAQGNWALMPGELHRFSRELHSMALENTPGAIAMLGGTEPGFLLSLTMTERGGVIGEWKFQPTPPEGPQMTGSFAMDQTFFNGLMEGVHALLDFCHRKD